MLHNNLRCSRAAAPRASRLVPVSAQWMRKKLKNEFARTLIVVSVIAPRADNCGGFVIRRVHSRSMQAREAMRREIAPL